MLRVKFIQLKRKENISYDGMVEVGALKLQEQQNLVYSVDSSVH